MTASEADKPGSGASRTATVPRIAGAGQFAMRARVPRPALQGLLALAAYLAVFIVGYALPLVLHPGLPQVGQTQVDPNFYVWSWRWWPITSMSRCLALANLSSARRRTLAFLDAP